MVIALLLLTIILEQLMFWPPLWRIRLYVVVILTLTIPGLTALFVMQYPSWLGLGVGLLSVGRLYNLLRIAKARMHEQYLRHTTDRTSALTCLAQLLVLGGLFVPLPSHIRVEHGAFWAAFVQLLMASCVLAVTIRNVYRTRYKQGTTFYADKELPTVSVLIPARNETTDLEECLRSVVASDYPKLEIIVLDDCSQAKTSDIIKSFAQDGVRFVRGQEPNDNWLAKNLAYQRLADEASGELLLFCGVDVRFGTHAIKALVTELLNRDKQMISILPHRLSGSLAGAFIQPMRYWWELSWPRKLVNRPPVLSTCWLITAKALKKQGNFAAVSHSILPEGYFARKLIAHNDYSFIRANDTLDVQTRKSLSEQRATAIRTRYPQLRRRPENVLLLLALDVVFLLGPFIMVVYGVVASDMAVVYASAAACVLLVANHLLIMQLTSPANVAIALINFPVEVVTDMVVTVVSMSRYEFGSVEWKDRNVCIPVMHVVPRLPSA